MVMSFAKFHIGDELKKAAQGRKTKAHTAVLIQYCVAAKPELLKRRPQNGDSVKWLESLYRLPDTRPA